MSLDAFIKPVIQAVTGLAKTRYEQWKSNSAIEQKVHEAFSHVADSIIVLSLDATFSRNLFRLAAGETIDVDTVVARGIAIERDGKPIVSEAELIADLKDFAYKLINAWQEISPKAGEVPTAFTIFRDKIDLLATGATFANKVTQNAEAVAMRLAESSQRELADFRQREQMYQYREQILQDQIQALTEAVTALAQQRKQPDALPGIDDALTQLAQRNTKAAEAIFQAIVERKAPDIHEAAAALRHLGALAFLHNTTKALEAYRRAVELDPNNPEGWNQLGHLLYRIGQFHNAADAYRQVLTCGEETGNRTLLLRAYGNLGNVYVIRGDLDQAEAMHRKALELDEALGRKEGIARQFGILGIVYRIRGDLDQAEAMHRKALELDEALGYKEGMARQFSNLGIVYWIRGDLDQAEAMHRKALELDEAMGRKEGIATAYGNLGIVYVIRGDLDQAEAMYRKALELDEAMGRKEGIATAYGNLGNVYEIRGNFQQAEIMYCQALTLFQEIGAVPHVERIQELLRVLRAQSSPQHSMVSPINRKNEAPCPLHLLNRET